MLLGRCCDVESAREMMVGARPHTDHSALKRLFRKSLEQLSKTLASEDT
jgi:hypothetical protein